jgi:hypothetical protein
MSPYLLHQVARQAQVAWHRELERQRLLAYFWVVAIPFGVIVGLFITNSNR